MRKQIILFFFRAALPKKGISGLEQKSFLSQIRHARISLCILICIPKNFDS